MVTEKELLSRLQINRGTLFKWRKEGLPHIKVGRVIRYDYPDVVLWLKLRSPSYGGADQQPPHGPQKRPAA
jgi:hypothetical protein